MKIGIITDLHIRGKNPINRLDNFYESIMIKFKEALSIFKKEKCKLILDAGDLLHSPIISLTICDDIIDLIDKTKIDYYTIFGNHPMVNAHLENSNATTLAHMFKRSKYLKYLEQHQQDNVFIQGYEYYHGIEGDIKKDGLLIEEKSYYELSIAVVHAMITEKKLPYQVLHIPYKELKTNYDYVILGHNHHEIGVKKVGKTTVIGLGAIARLTAHEIDYKRKPKVAILNTKTGEVGVKELKKTKSYKEVFDLERLKKIKESAGNLDKFINSLQSTKLQGLNVVGVLNEISEKQNIDKEVTDEIIKRIGEHEDE